MRLSTKGRYAITAMLDLALKGGDDPVTLSEISHNQGISLSYLEQLFASLRSKGLVKGVRGPGGGYYLGRPVSQITIADIICAVDEWVDMTRSRRFVSHAYISQRCPSHNLWDDLSDHIFEFLAGITLGELIERGHHHRFETKKAA
ncbi:MAG: Rrf2 family transcriptional regulator [Gammaproteobacteria bacterium]|nr:Rrf2 family transcriptional regulator [Gammaproteobacteria bacterium]MBU1653514.1 Rrf2 family transcriptional regulator [Gammaproteobacteria bacterium]MBU1961862.1 Rrf2 family transcriptional regulator [Gammaproteobacteria bacterium]